METTIKILLYKINYIFQIFYFYLHSMCNIHSNNIHLRIWRSLIRFIEGGNDTVNNISHFVSIIVWLPGDRRGTPTSGRYDGVPVPGERHQEHWRQRRQRQQREHQWQQ